MTFRQTLRHTWLTLTAPLLIVTVAAYIVLAVAGIKPATNDLPYKATPDGPSYAERLAADHACYTDGDQPETLPTRALVETNPLRGARITKSSVGFAMWLGPDRKPDTGDERPGTLLAFCP